MNYTTIKGLTRLLTFLLLAIVVTNCSDDKEDGFCFDDLYGTYQGLLESDAVSNPTEVLWIHDSNSDLENEVSISGYLGVLNPNADIVAFTGNLSMDCQKIEISEQQVLTGTRRISGSFTLLDGQLNGTLLYGGREYNYSLNKN